MMRLKYYIHNLQNHTCYVAPSFEKFLDYFANHNKGRYMGLGYWDKSVDIDPKIHQYKDYNSALNHIAMNLSDTEWAGHYQYPVRDYSTPVEKTRRYIMVVDEYDRVIDPRHYWNQIAVRKVKSPSWRRNKHPYIFRFDPVEGTRKRRGGRYRTNIRTFQERKLSCDPEIREYIKPNRNLMNLPSSWDQHPRNTNHCWKAKKIEKQWIKHNKI